MSAMKQRATKVETTTDEAPKFVSVLDQHKTVAEAGKEPGLIPTGTWLLKATSAKLLRLTREDKETGQEVTYERLQFVHEPISPTSSVDPEEVEAVDEHGKSLYDGKRIFTKINLDYAGAGRQVRQILLTHGYDPDEDYGDTLKSVIGGSMKGRQAYGAVEVRSWKNNDGTNGRDNEVKSWSSIEDMEAADSDDE